MINTEWFVKKQNSFLGPFTTEEIFNRHRSGILQVDDILWGSDFGEWLDYEKWTLNSLPLIQNYLTARQHFWKLKVNETTVFDNLSYTEIIETLLDADLSKVEICEENSSNFETVLKFDFFVSSIMILRRKHKRYPAKGTTLIRLESSSAPLLANIRDIAIAGIGLVVTKTEKFKISDTVELTVNCTQLAHKFSASGTVVFKSKVNRAIGIEFKEIYDDGLTLLFKYINTFDSKMNTDIT